MKSSRLLEKIVYAAAFLAGSGVIFMTLIICYEVLMRYVFNRPTIWVTEMSQYLMVIIAFLAMGYTELKNHHTRVDLFVNKMPGSVNRILHYASLIITTLACCILTWKSAERALNYFHYKASSEWAPPLFPVYIWIPIGYLLLALAAFLGVSRLRGRK